MICNTEKYIALSGGVGGAKLALGLSHVLDTEQLLLVANTGDDFQHLGLSVSPDIDTLVYTLSGLNNKKLGWGRQDESWNFMQACEELEMDTWFRLGDKDLALHLFRTQALSQGLTLSEVTNELCKRFNIKTQIVPMSDDPIKTFVNTSMGTLPFQEYFVKYQCLPEVTGIEYKGIDNAKMAPSFDQYLNDPALQAIIICPSNPFLSVQPILSIPAVKNKLKKIMKPVIIVSPIVEGEALKGPTAKMMKELNIDCDVNGVVELYADIADGIVIDNKDSVYVEKIESRGIKVHTSNIVMQSLQHRIDLAKDVVEFSKMLCKR
ncbi:MAG: 2-phospho-L-lactate transferase [Proteobacteria bacterium]|nr:2-phospho-L-lactate transferase [Pseudomonadota bacterium]NOG59546.1 2-phospho-L-lactate transferase [Pseudomonadota bacterium]